MSPELQVLQENWCQEKKCEWRKYSKLEKISKFEKKLVFERKNANGENFQAREKNWCLKKKRKSSQMLTIWPELNLVFLAAL